MQQAVLTSAGTGASCSGRPANSISSSRQLWLAARTSRRRSGGWSRSVTGKASLADQVGFSVGAQG
jgi:hypothetical protein